MLPKQPKAFLCRFAVVYVLLLLPWPGFREAYGEYFQAFGGMIFAGQTERSELTFETPERNSPLPQDTRVVIVNKTLMNYDGSGPVRNLDFDAHAVGWKPLALLAALVIATPLPWGRRIRALAFGALAMHLYFLLFLFVAIWNESTEISLLLLTPFWKSALNELKTMLVSQLSLCLPVLIWVVVTFRREDMIGILNSNFTSSFSTAEKGYGRKGRCEAQ